MKLKKLLCSVLALAMVLSTMGTVAFAEEADVIVLNAGTYTWESRFAGKTVVAADGEEVILDMTVVTKPGLGGADTSFEGITFEWGNAGHNGLQHSGNLTYTNCVINGQPFLYGESETFENCTFNQTDINQYNVWTYAAKEVKFIGCTFNSAGRCVLVYGDGGEAGSVEFEDTTLNASNAVDGKAAIEIDTSLMTGNATITVDENTIAIGFGAGSKSNNTLWNVKTDPAKKESSAVVSVADETVYAKVVDEEGTVGDIVASVSGAYYSSLQDALKATKDMDTAEVTIFAGEYSIDAFTLGTNVREYPFADNLSIVADGDVTIKLNSETKSYQNGVAYQYFVGGSWYVCGKSIAFDGINFVFEDTNTEDGQTMAEIQTYASESLSYTNCTFDNVSVSPWGDNSTGKTAAATIEGCTFSNIASRSAIHQSKALNLTVANNDFIDVVNGVHISGNELATLTVTSNDFDGIADGSAAIYFGNESWNGVWVGDYSNATITVTGNTSDAALVRNGNESLTVAHIDALSDETANTFESAFTGNSVKFVACIGNTNYVSLADAFAAANDGDTISLIYNEGDAPIAMNGALYGNKTVSITGDAVVDWSKGSLFVGRGGEGNGKLIFDNANLTSTEASLKNGTYGIHVSMEEYGASNKADGEVVFKNSNIDLSYLMNKNNVTVDGGNLTVWYGFAVGARPASETNNVQRAAELKLSNNAVVEVKNHNGMGIGYESNGIANIDAGSTLKISAASLAVAANSTVNSKGNIIGLLDVADGATMNFTDGFYTEDPSAYCAEGYEVDKSEVEGYAYTVVPKAAQKINVVFENGKNEGEYILKLKSADEKEIYKFVSAELTFKNNSESLGDAIGTLPFEFVENTNIDVEKSLEDANTDACALKNPANRITATDIELGTIKFTSQGTPALAVTAGTVVATRYNTNLPKYYSTDAELNGEGLTLDISATLDGTPVPDTTRDVAVKIEYNLGLVGGVWADDEIEVTLVDKFGDEVTATKVSNGLFTFEDVATGRIEVKLSAPGFRTYTYDAILYETEEENNPLVLNFWNNVKTGEDEDPLKKIDDSNAIEKEMAHNFVVGDIVMDFIVDRYDLAAVTSYYGMYNITERTNASEKYLKYDLNRDGNIDIIDVHYVLHTFGN